MKHTNHFLPLLLAGALTLSVTACTAAAPKESAVAAPADPEAAYESFLNAVSPDYAYDIAYELTTNPDFFNSELGGRTAGSDAEHAAADYLVQTMEEIGLSDVEKVAADCDRWQFNGASFTVDGVSYPVYSYATASTPAEGITAEVVYVGKGTMWDYEGLDVTGKIVLIDIDQRNDWWITYPMLEAQHQGAAAILAANVGGFSQIADDALNCQDICGPTAIPTLSIGLSDSQEIQEKLAAGPVTATLVVDNEVNVGEGTTYNIMGRIPGKSSDHQILVGGHYDVHFKGFQDDNCAVGLVLAMAKAMIDSGYQPENDLVFCLHGAEEWGSSYTQYDWTVGAWEMINRVHPDWVGKTLAFLNFELPAYEFDTYTSSYSAPEMYAMLDYFVNEYPYSPEPEGCFEDGVLTEGYQTYTYSDDFSYYAAGVPSTVNGFLLQKDMETVFPFYEEIYHSQYDTPETYNEAVMNFNIRYYGALAMYIDQTPALYLDFTAQYDRILASLDEELLTRVGVDMDAYHTALESLKQTAQAMSEDICSVNEAYAEARNAQDTAKMEELWNRGRELTTQNLTAFAYAQKHLLGLMYERPIVPHEAPQENITLCENIISCLEEGQVATAVDEYAWTVNNVLEWYAMYFSPEVIAIQDDMLWGESNADNLYWGTGKSFAKADVDQATRSLYTRYEEEGGDFSQEIAVYQKAVEAQSEILLQLAQQEIDSINELTQLLA
ncbi:M28 family peptidase [Pseudoflavonifractor sp. DSM 107456]|uniref:M28 family peptidase n=1 Tax=Pseudoflavonifractor gallinarum TaxID=2779352 RepID=A0ABR9RDR8_9FIRM|nr:M28 family peptidase [Pseudoflavonifractor gallinarum]MBE5056850.1 M28 family peptidase [Pseudoflavonifractor gallinarum]